VVVTAAATLAGLASSESQDHQTRHRQTEEKGRRDILFCAEVLLSETHPSPKDSLAVAAVVLTSPLYPPPPIRPTHRAKGATRKSAVCNSQINSRTRAHILSPPFPDISCRVLAFKISL